MGHCRGPSLPDLDPAVIPAGREYLSTIQQHHFWTWVQRSSACAFWNGSVVGGGPALADPYASTLHPLVAVPTLLLGVPAGAKLALAGALFMAGVAQVVDGARAGPGPGGVPVEWGHGRGRRQPRRDGWTWATIAMVVSTAALLPSSGPRCYA